MMKIGNVISYFVTILFIVAVLCGVFGLGFWLTHPEEGEPETLSMVVPDDTKCMTGTVTVTTRPVVAATHFKCAECGKWDYVKNLREYPAEPYNNVYEYIHDHSDRETIHVHPECSKVEACDCHDGLRAKTIDKRQEDERCK